jgi:ribulose 1,5-bisphosphate synthetase/thiazole synthase
MSAARQPARRDLARPLAQFPAWDLVVIGGGATGLGEALDAAARGLSVALARTVIARSAIKQGETTVRVLTGTGLKASDAIGKLLGLGARSG